MSLYDELNTVEDVQRLIDDGVREGETIDYKRLQDWVKNESGPAVAKDASAFANSAGGLLVFGVSTRKDGDSTMPDRIVGLEAGLIQKVQRAITDFVRHPIPGVRWKSLPIGGPPQVFLVEVPASPLAPHQHARERVYYRREGDQNLPMPHDLVELYFGRRLGPVLDASLEMLAQPTRIDATGEWSHQLAIRVENTGAGSAREVMHVLSQSRDNPFMQIVRVGRESGMDAPAWLEGDRLVWRVSSPALIVHPTERVRSLELRVNGPVPYGLAGLECARLSLYADRMSPSHWSLHIHPAIGRTITAFELRRVTPPDTDAPPLED